MTPPPRASCPIFLTLSFMQIRTELAPQVYGSRRPSSVGVGRRHSSVGQGLAFPMFILHGPIGQIFYKKALATRLWGKPMHTSFFPAYLAICLVRGGWVGAWTVIDRTVVIRAPSARDCPLGRRIRRGTRRECVRDIFSGGGVVGERRAQEDDSAERASGASCADELEHKDPKLNDPIARHL